MAGIFRLFNALEDGRLTTAIHSLKAEIENRPDTGDDRDATTLGEIRKLLKLADDALVAGHIEDGWRYLKAARQVRVELAKEPELVGLAIELYHEAITRITNWRKDAIIDVLKPIPGVGDENVNWVCNYESGEMHQRVRKAMRLRDEHSDRQHFNNRFRHMQRQLAIWLLVLTLALLLAMAAVGTLFPDTTAPPPSVLILAAVMFGALGACFSTIRAITRTDIELDELVIPHRFREVGSIFARIFVGAAAGLIAYALLKTVFMGTSKEIPPAVIYLVAFVAGFCDTVVVKGFSALNETRHG